MGSPDAYAFTAFEASLAARICQVLERLSHRHDGALVDQLTAGVLALAHPDGTVPLLAANPP